MTEEIINTNKIHSQLIINAAKRVLTGYIDSLEIDDDVEKVKILISFSINVVCQLMVDNIEHNIETFHAGFAFVIEDMNSWKDHYLSNNPYKSINEKLKEYN